MQSQIEKLKELNKRLAQLLDEPEEGLASWVTAVGVIVLEMATITGVVVFTKT